ncbi:tRNA (adenosine(37)-N6)-threonylcarbamoyltransferase complex ATPase subunit type 1 TsaE [Neptuniibacter halophilus]|uniref:tRNA (adenosine(37)-N6)-threonylcarbamoyltransferase complex ATPase subunit type 1 TsaE n=1 Tax=Neptuniibacter halophilus TaxID=651666 RepID=UPI002572F37C|nr:tRNA (adenosine(37)-N6)-threonylcarbamoyltransferase complex ATPase subunit type 1 TsaE [Neptuniibacter halophilus]
MSDQNQISLPDEAAMVAFGGQIAVASGGQGVVFLLGDLGMGKTTLSRGILQGFGHQGAVKSPTYTLVEPYEIGTQRVYHFDLYRLADPEELEYLGIRDYFDAESLCLVEWPERGRGILPEPDLVLRIELEGRGRRLNWEAKTETGRTMADKLLQAKAAG